MVTKPREAVVEAWEGAKAGHAKAMIQQAELGDAGFALEATGLGQMARAESMIVGALHRVSGNEAANFLGAFGDATGIRGIAGASPQQEADIGVGLALSIAVPSPSGPGVGLAARGGTRVAGKVLPRALRGGMRLGKVRCWWRDFLIRQELRTKARGVADLLLEANPKARGTVTAIQAKDGARAVAVSSGENVSRLGIEGLERFHEAHNAATISGGVQGFSGNCSEVAAVGRLLNHGSDVRGAILQTVAVGKTAPGHKSIKAACRTCSKLIQGLAQ